MLRSGHPAPAPGAPERRPLLKRGAVTATLHPVTIEWHDRPIALSPLEAQLLVALLRRGRMRWDEVSHLLDENGGSASSRDVLIHRIRRKFEEVGAGDPMQTVRGWGLRFRAEPDRAGSMTLWIGATEDGSTLHLR